MDLNKDVKFIKGVGPNRIKQLNKLGIYTLEDVITYYPRGYENRGIKKNIADLNDGEEALIEAKCVSKMTEIIVRDETATCTLTWFNSFYLKNKFKVGEIYKFYGKVKRKINQIEIMSPIFDDEESNKNTGRIIPIYPSINELSQNNLRKIIENGLSQVQDLPETIPDYLVSKYHLMSKNEAINQIHMD